MTTATRPMKLARCRAVALILHRWVGVGLAGFLIMAGLTGSVIAFHEPLDAWLNPALFRAAQTGPALPLSEIEARFAAAEPEARITYLLFGVPAGGTLRAFVAPRDPAHPLPYDQVFIDPATGAVQGARQYGACCLAREKFIPFLYELHYSLMAGTVGSMIMGLIGLTWFFDCLAAISLTLPRGKPFWRRWAQGFSIKRGARGFRLAFDLHRAFGLWAWALLSIIAFSGFAINLDRPIFHPALGAILPLSPDPFLQAAPQAEGTFNPDAMVEAATRAVRPAWSGPPSGLYCPDSAKICAIYFAPSPSTEGTGFGSPIVYAARANGAILRVVQPGAGTTGDLIERLQFPLHSGQVAGLAGRIIISLTGIATALLAATGLIIFARKYQARRGRSGNA